MTQDQSSQNGMVYTREPQLDDDFAEKIARRVVQRLLEHQQSYLRDPNLLLKQIDIGKIVELANGLKTLFSSNDNNQRRKHR